MEESAVTIDIKKIMKKYLWLLLLTTILGGVTGKIIALNGPAPTYETSALILLEKAENQTGGNIVVNPSNEVERFHNTAQTLVDRPVILARVREELKLEKSNRELANQILATNENGSQVMRIKVEDPNAEQASMIANKTAQVFIEEINNYLDVARAEIIEKAEIGEETKVIHTRTNANILMGVIAGFVLGVFALFALHSLVKPNHELNVK